MPTERQQQQARDRFTVTMGLDAKRPDAWTEYGYKEKLGFQDFYNLYTRHGVAAGAIDRVAEKVFQTAPWVIQGAPEDEKKPTTDWELGFQTMAEELDLWWYFKEAYAMRMVGAWSALILEFANDPGALSEEVATGAVLTGLVPVWRGQLKPVDYDALGKVKSWNYTPTGFDATEMEQGAPVTLHPSRVYVVGDYRRGRSVLESGYNAFVDMEKVTGGAGEGYLKNASRQLHVNFDMEADPAKKNQPDDEVTDDFNETARALNTRSDSVLVTQGADVNPLVANLPDPEKPFNVSLQVAMASLRIAARIVVGSQTGERASVEDIRDFNERCQGDRSGEVAREVRGFVRHLELYKVLEAPGRVSIMWDNLAEPTAGDRADLALKLAQTNQANAITGDRIFTPEQIQIAAGYEAQDAGQLGETDDDEPVAE
jgi:hypothetical protein